MWQSISQFAKNHVLLLVVIGVLSVLILLFHEIMTPFIIAIIVAYLIEPLVKRMHHVKIKNHPIPRGVAVLVAYLIFLSFITGVGFAFIPSLTNEISQATRELPQFFEKLKNEDIPRWNHNIDEILVKLSLRESIDAEKSVKVVQEKVDAALGMAMKDVRELDSMYRQDVDISGESPLLLDDARRHASKSEAADKNSAEHASAPVLLTFKQTSKGTYSIMAGDTPLVFKPGKDGSFTLDTTPPEKKMAESQKAFSIEDEIGSAVLDFVESSTQYAGNALSFIQSAIEFIVNTFVQFILVFMLAAFISIDSPKIVSYARDLFKSQSGDTKGVDEYISRLTKGLSGVVAGQLIICCIDGALTGLGLWVLGVDFALLLGIISGICCIVPIFGTIISAVPAVILGFVQGPLTALIILVWILCVHFMDTNFFTPKIVGKQSNLHPVIIIFALLAGQQAAGVLGLVLAVPVTSIIKTTLEFLLERPHRLAVAAAGAAPVPVSNPLNALKQSAVPQISQQLPSDSHSAHEDSQNAKNAIPSDHELQNMPSSDAADNANADENENLHHTQNDKSDSE